MSDKEKPDTFDRGKIKENSNNKTQTNTVFKQ